MFDPLSNSHVFLVMLIFFLVCQSFPPQIFSSWSCLLVFSLVVHLLEALQATLIFSLCTISPLNGVFLIFCISNRSSWCCFLGVICVHLILLVVILKCSWSPSSFGAPLIHSCEGNNFIGWWPCAIWRLFACCQASCWKIFPHPRFVPCTCMNLLACLRKNYNETYYPLPS